MSSSRRARRRRREKRRKRLAKVPPRWGPSPLAPLFGLSGVLLHIVVNGAVP